MKAVGMLLQVRPDSFFCTMPLKTDVLIVSHTLIPFLQCKIVLKNVLENTQLEKHTRKYFHFSHIAF